MDWWDSKPTKEIGDTSWIQMAIEGIMNSEAERLKTIMVGEDTYNIIYSLDWWVRNMSCIDRFIDLYLPFLSPYRFEECDAK